MFTELSQYSLLGKSDCDEGGAVEIAEAGVMLPGELRL